MGNLEKTGMDIVDLFHGKGGKLSILVSLLNEIFFVRHLCRGYELSKIL